MSTEGGGSVQRKVQSTQTVRVGAREPRKPTGLPSDPVARVASASQRMMYRGGLPPVRGAGLEYAGPSRVTGAGRRYSLLPPHVTGAGQSYEVTAGNVTRVAMGYRREGEPSIGEVRVPVTLPPLPAGGPPPPGTIVPEIVALPQPEPGEEALPNVTTLGGQRTRTDVQITKEYQDAAATFRRLLKEAFVPHLQDGEMIGSADIHLTQEAVTYTLYKNMPQGFEKRSKLVPFKALFKEQKGNLLWGAYKSYTDELDKMMGEKSSRWRTVRRNTPGSDRGIFTRKSQAEAALPGHGLWDKQGKWNQEEADAVSKLVEQDYRAELGQRGIAKNQIDNGWERARKRINAAIESHKYMYDELRKTKENLDKKVKEQGLFPRYREEVEKSLKEVRQDLRLMETTELLPLAVAAAWTEVSDPTGAPMSKTLLHDCAVEVKSAVERMRAAERNRLEEGVKKGVSWSIEKPFKKRMYKQEEKELIKQKLGEDDKESCTLSACGAVLVSEVAEDPLLAFDAALDAVRLSSPGVANSAFLHRGPEAWGLWNALCAEEVKNVTQNQNAPTPRGVHPVEVQICEHVARGRALTDPNVRNWNQLGTEEQKALGLITVGLMKKAEDAYI